MAPIQHPHKIPADVAAAVHDASERLAMLWVNSYATGLSHRVSPSQLRALLAISQHGTTNLTDLASDIDAMLSSASRLCDRLVAAGLIERGQSEDDRRELSLRLSPDGRRLLEAIESERQSAIADVLAELPAEDQAALLRGLEAFTAVASRRQRPPRMPRTPQQRPAALGE